MSTIQMNRFSINVADKAYPFFPVEDSMSPDVSPDNRSYDAICKSGSSVYGYYIIDNGRHKKTVFGFFEPTTIKND